MYPPNLSVATEATTHRPLRWWSAAALEVLARELNRVFDAWAQRWDLSLEPAVAFNAHEAPGAPADAAQWQAWCDDAGPSATWCWAAIASGDLRAKLADTLYGSPSHASSSVRSAASIAQGVAGRALRDLEDELAKLLVATDGSTQAATGTPPSRAWSGDVRVRLPWCGTELWLHLRASRVAPLLESARRRWVGKTQALDASVLSAIAHQPLRLRVEMNPTELDLGTLQSLRLGDVLTLGHPLEAPLTLHAANAPSGAGTAVCNAYLGARQGKRAIELVQGPGV